MIKDHHADELADVVNYYFLAQRVKPVDSEDEIELHVYSTQLELVHQLILYAMKAKQTTDVKHIEKLRTVLSDFERVYFSP
jgi:nickel superoxide dismutase